MRLLTLCMTSYVVMHALHLPITSFSKQTRNKLGKKNNSLSVFQVVQYGTNNDNQNHKSHNTIRTTWFLVFLRLYDLLDALSHLCDRLIHVVIDTIDDGSLFDDELIQVLEDLSELLSTLGYMRVHSTVLPICWISCSRDCVSFRIMSMAPFWLWLNPYNSPHRAALLSRSDRRPLLLSIVNQLRKPHSHTSQLLEELLLLLSITHRELLKTARQAFLYILKDSFFSIICVFCLL